MKSVVFIIKDYYIIVFIIFRFSIALCLQNLYFLMAKLKVFMTRNDFPQNAINILADRYYNSNLLLQI